MDKKKRPAKREIVGAGAGNSGNKTLEEALRESEERYRQIFEQDRAVKLLIEPNTGKIVKANRAAASFYGYPIETLQQMRISDINRLDPAEIAAEMQAALLEQRTFFVFPHRLASGEVRQVEVYSSPIDLGGQRVLYSIIHDITERKHMEDELRQREGEYSSLVENAPDMIVRFDTNLRHIYCNRAVERQLGRSGNTYIGKTPSEIGEPDEHSQFIEKSLMYTLDTGKEHQVEQSYDTPSGKVYYQTRIVPEYDDTGKVKSLLAITREVTESRQAEEKLRESEEKFRRMFHQSPLGVAIVSPHDYRFLSVNNTMCDLLGYSDDELTLLTFGEITHPDNLDNDREQVRRLAAGEIEQYVTDKKYIRKDGGVIWGHLSLRMIKDSKGNNLYFLPLIENITEKKKAEEAVRLQATLLDSATDSIFLLDTKGNFLYFNEAACQSHGYTREDMSGMSMADLLGPNFSWIGPQTAEILAKGQATFESTHRRKDGSIMDTEVHAKTINQEGQIRILSIIHDITTRKKADEELLNNKVKLDNALQSSNMGVWSWEINENKRIFDDQVCALLGLNPATFGGTAEEFFNAVHHDDLDKIKEALARTIEQDIPYNPEYRTVWRDGSIHYISARGRLMRDDKGRPLRISGIIWDNSKRKQAEAALQYSETFLSNIIDKSPLSMWISDNNGTMIRLNQACRELFGVLDEEVVGRYNIFEDNILEDQGFMPLIRAVFTKGTTAKFTLIYDLSQITRLKLKTKVVILEVTVSAVLSDSGRISNAIIQHVDITERKLAEGALAESEERYRLLASNSEDVIWTTDLQFRFTYISPSVYKLRGLTQEEALQQEVMDTLTPDSQHRVQALIESRMPDVEKGLPVSARLDIEQYCKNGSTVWVEVAITTMADDSGTLKGFVGASRNITDRKRSEEALSESETKYRNLIELLHEGIWVIDENARTTYVNVHMAKMLGYTIEEMIGKDIFYFMDEKIRAMAARNLEDRRRGKSATQDLEFVKKDGTTIFVSLSSAPIIDKDGNFKGAIAGVQDITEHKRLEDEQQRVAKLESVGLLAGGIAHDFNNILTSILGNVTMARMDTEPDSEIYKSLEQAEKASQRAKDLTKQLLTFSKGGAPVTRLASLTELIKDTASFALRGSNVKCSFSISDDLWHAEIDAGQVSQVIQNLVINAQQSMPTGGAIEIFAENISLSETQSLSRGLPLNQGNYLRIAVVDHGVGIPAEHLDKVFDPFFTTKKKGSGLGLATSFSIARQHGGYLSVESGPGSGSTFYLYLPASMEIIPPKQHKKEAIKAKGKARIMVMDDEQGIREIAGRMLGILGYKDIEFAENGAEATNLYKEAMESGKPFSVVILDLTIPGGMGGKETVSKLLEIDPGVKALVSSGYVDDSIIANYKEHGFSGIVVKPYTLEELGKAVHDLIW